MAKTIAINPSWYWPDDVPRLCGVPPMFCDRLMAERWSRRRPEAVAVVDSGGAITYAELWSRAQAVAEGIRERDGHGGGSAENGSGGEGARHTLSGPTGIDGVVELIGALAARRRAVIVDPDSPTAAAAAAQVQAGEVADVHDPAVDLVTAEGWVAGHSHYSLVSGALSLAAFLEIERPESWLCALPLWTWEGLYSALVPLYLGGTAVMCGPEGMTDAAANLVDDHKVAYALGPFELVRDLSRSRPRRLAASLKRNLRGLLLTTDRPFAAGERRKARKELDVPILTVWGLTETGPILASHPSWYVEESVGIPVTNVEVQPANPKTGEPLDTNWELLDYATMVIRAPQLMAGYEGEAAQDERMASRIEDRWFKTWASASFDANGMMYLVES
jgi:acyl-CoA synthetase (AMP-forming)/AMP-acid ligase II